MGLPDSNEQLLADVLDRAFGFVGEHDGLAADLVNDLAWEARRLERELAEARDLLRLTYDEDCGLSVWSDTPLGQRVRAEQSAEGEEINK